MANQNKPVATPEDFEALQLANIALESKVTELNAALEGTKVQLEDRENAIAAHLSHIETLQTALETQSQSDRSLAVSTERPRHSTAKQEYNPAEWELSYPIYRNGKAVTTADLTSEIVAELVAMDTPLLKRI